MRRKFAKYVDAAVVGKAAQGDECAFNLIYNAYHQDVRSTIRQYIHNIDECDELTQQIFVSLWESRSLLTDVHSFDDYLFIAMRNRVFKYFSRLRKEALVMQEVQNRLHEDQVPVYSRVELHDYLALWNRAIEVLPTQQRQVYTLVEREERTVDYVAENLGLARSTVKKHLELARRSVRNFIDHTMERSVTVTALVALSTILLFIF